MDTTTRSHPGRPGAVPATRERRPVDLQAPLVVERLTAREMEVLGHLSQLLTTEEIAEEMFVSVNTVRTHVRSVLRKLSASRRNEAVRRAWDLQLLPRRSDPPSGVPTSRPGSPARGEAAVPRPRDHGRSETSA